MAQLLLELFSEEIPARMQTGAARDLERLFKAELDAAGLPYEQLRTFAGPRRLTLVAEGLPMAQADREEELKGPKTSAPEQALEGFLRKTGLTREQLTERDGVFYAVLSKKGRPTHEVVAEAVDRLVRAFPWPKSMRWGRGTLRWIRPLKRIVCLLDGVVVPFAIDGIESGDETEGHRFLGSGKPFRVKSFEDYRQRLMTESVILDAADRKAAILAEARTACASAGLELVEDEGLLEEVAGLAEWPVPLLGDMDPAFLDLPPEVIRTSMRTHQKYFAVRDPATGRLAPRFVLVSNLEAKDGGAEIKRGNAKVLSARLNDARFFWDEDLKAGFEPWLKKLEGVTFHAKLGTVAERVERIAALARQIAPAVGADPDLAEQAARLCKGDLASGMVGEFPELQGVMGGYYARKLLPDNDFPAWVDGTEDPMVDLPKGALDGDTPAPKSGRDQIADAIRDHYKPLGPSDTVPTAPVTVAVSLADKLDTLVGFFAIDEKPTGSKDPYALRRAALGVIRIVLESGARVPLGGAITAAARPFKAGEGVATDLLAFFADRLKVQLREEGKPHDLVDAVFALGDDDLVRLTARVEALDGFLHTEDGQNLLAGYRRAVNILKAEAKKNPAEAETYSAPVDPARLTADEERALHEALERTTVALEPKLGCEDFSGAMADLAALRGPVDAFFDRVLVNDPDPDVRLNRLRLLSGLRDAANRVADFGQIAG